MTHGRLLQRFEVSARGERELAWVRAFGAGAVGISGLWLALVATNAVQYLFSGGALLAAVGWSVVARRARRRAKEAPGWYLALHERALELGQGPQKLAVPWSQITQVEVDEERLVVRLERCDGPALQIEPLYVEVGLHELGDAIARAHRGA